MSLTKTEKNHTYVKRKPWSTMILYLGRTQNQHFSEYTFWTIKQFSTRVRYTNLGVQIKCLASVRGNYLKLVRFKLKWDTRILISNNRRIWIPGNSYLIMFYIYSNWWFNWFTSLNEKSLNKNCWKIQRFLQPSYNHKMSSQLYNNFQ